MSSDRPVPSTRDGDLNLSTHRLADDVWTRSDREARRQVALPWAIGAVALLMAARAIGGHRWRGALLAGLGAGAAVWMAVNPGRARATGRRMMTQLSEWRYGPDLVSEASEESFPASDAPSWTPTTGTGLRRQTTSMH